MPRLLGSGATIDDVTTALDADGYAIVEGLLPPEQRDRAARELRAVLAATPVGRNPFEGEHTRRVYALFAKTRALDDAATSPLVLGVVASVLGHAQLSAPVGIEIGPGEVAQVLHYDDAIYPVARPHPEIVLNTMWALDDFTEANGATRLVEGSHRWTAERPREASATVAAEMPAGSVMFYLGSLWHGGGANRTDKPRLGVVIEFAASWVRPQESQLLAVPPEIVRALPDALQELLGYNIRPPFIGYVDGRHPRRLLDADDTDDTDLATDETPTPAH